MSALVHGGLGLIWHAAGRLKEVLWYFPYPPGRFNVDGVYSRVTEAGERHFSVEPSYVVMRGTRYAPGYIQACTQEFVERGWTQHSPVGLLLSTGDSIIPLHRTSTTRTQALRLVRQHVTCPACLVQLDELLALPVPAVRASATSPGSSPDPAPTTELEGSASSSGQ